MAATCKHFAAHSLEEAEGLSRANFDARVDARDMAETYLPAFHACAIRAQARSVMCAYNKCVGASRRGWCGFVCKARCPPAP